MKDLCQVCERNGFYDTPATYRLEGSDCQGDKPRPFNWLLCDDHIREIESDSRWLVKSCFELEV